MQVSKQDTLAMDRTPVSVSRPSSRQVNASSPTSNSNGSSGPYFQSMMGDMSTEAWLYSSGTREESLHGIGSQFDDVFDPRPSATFLSRQKNRSCPYHDRLMSTTHCKTAQSDGQSANRIRSYVDGKPSEQYALSRQPYSGKLSTDKGCVCLLGCAPGQT